MNALSYIKWWAIVFVLTYVALSFTVIAPPEVKELNGILTETIFVKPFAKAYSMVKPADSQDRLSAVPLSETPDVTESVLPIRIIIDKIGVDSPVLNPKSPDITMLDQALLQGVVRYPGSGGLSDDSNMFMFGHSTSYRTVQNQAYKAFNRLSELNIGDYIRVQTAEMEYLYRVTMVSQINKDEALVEFKSGVKMLTLSTCDTFGEKTDRFVVESKYVKSYPKP